MKLVLQGFKPISVLERLPQLAATHWLVNHFRYSNTETLCYFASNSPKAREGQPAGSFGLQHILNPNPSLKSTSFLHLCNSKQLQKYTCITLRCLEAKETSTTCLLSKMCSDGCSHFVAICFSIRSVIPTGSSCASRKSHKDRACPVHPFTTWDLFISRAPLSSAKKKLWLGTFCTHVI